MVYGERKVGGRWRYFSTASGELTTGWAVIPGGRTGRKKVYYDNDGCMVYGERRIDGKWRYFSTASGELTAGWAVIPGGRTGRKKVYYDDKGCMVYGWKKIGGKTYYLSTASGEMMTGRQKVDGMWYRLDDAGVLQTPSGKVSLAMVDTESNYRRIKASLEAAGASVTVFTSSKIDVSRFDGLVLPGGADITPSLYGEKYNGAEDCDYELDVMQMAALNSFVKAGKPVLGICRGCQLINVAFGGTLDQDIDGHTGTYNDTVISGGLMKYIYGTALSDCRCGHHQCAKAVGKDLTVTQRSRGDNRIEALEHNTKPVYGVQWHPEKSEAKGAKVFETFIKVCQVWK